MDSLLAIASAPPLRQARPLASRDVEPATYPPATPPTGPTAIAALYPGKLGDPATDQQRMMHFISHIDAECFIALLQILDPVPHDYRARAEYRRFYRQLHEALEIPLLAQDA